MHVHQGVSMHKSKKWKKKRNGCTPQCSLHKCKLEANEAKQKKQRKKTNNNVRLFGGKNLHENKLIKTKE